MIMLHSDAPLPSWVEFPALAHPALDDFAREVAQALHAPIAQVSIVSQAGQTMPGAAGLTSAADKDRTAPLAFSICQHVVRSGAPFVVNDLRGHPTLHDSPAVASLGVVAYAGVPLHNLAGQPVGALCAMDFRPRAWPEQQIAWLLERSAAVSLTLQSYSIELRMAESSFAMARARATCRAAHAASAALAESSGAAAHRDGLLARLADDLVGVEEIADLTRVVSRYATLSLHASAVAIVLESPVPGGGGPVCIDGQPVPDWAREPGGLRPAVERLPLRISESGERGSLVLRWDAVASVPARSTLQALTELLAPTVEWVVLEKRRRALHSSIVTDSSFPGTAAPQQPTARRPCA